MLWLNPNWFQLWSLKLFELMCVLILLSSLGNQTNEFESGATESVRWQRRPISERWDAVAEDDKWGEQLALVHMQMRKQHKSWGGEESGKQQASDQWIHSITSTENQSVNATRWVRAKLAGQNWTSRNGCEDNDEERRQRQIRARTRKMDSNECTEWKLFVLLNESLHTKNRSNLE